MASSSGNSSGFSSQIQNSGSEEGLMLMDQRKRRRMESNRESARRSRMRKQKQLDDLIDQIANLKKENNQIITSMSITDHKWLNVEAGNSVLRAQVAELSQRLDSLNNIISCFNTSIGFGGDFEGIHGNFMENSWNFNHPMAASPNFF